jgi:hypothetical protein
LNHGKQGKITEGAALAVRPGEAIGSGRIAPAARSIYIRSIESCR